MKYRTVLLFMLIVTASASSVFADYIHLKNGTLLKGKVIKVSDSSIEYDPEGEIPFDTVSRADVEKIVYDNGKSVILNSSTENVPAADSSTAVPAANGNNGVRPGAHRHDGFFFRSYAGYGVMKSTVTSNNGDYTFSGLDFTLGIQAGYAITDNIIPFMEYRLIGATATTTKHNGESYISNVYKQNISAGGLGIGLCVYIPDTQFFLSGAIFSHNILFDGDLIDETAKTGSAFGISAGYEFWVSDNWGIGFTGFYYRGKSSFDKNAYKDSKSVTNQFSDTIYRTIGLGVSFTYN